jgi:hypothetical protein
MPIEEFKNRVGAGKHYGTDSGGLDHWYYSVYDLPEPIRENALRIIKELTGRKQ